MAFGSGLKGNIALGFQPIDYSVEMKNKPDLWHGRIGSGLNVNPEQRWIRCRVCVVSFGEAWVCVTPQPPGHVYAWFLPLCVAAGTAMTIVTFLSSECQVCVCVCWNLIRVFLCLRHGFHCDCRYHVFRMLLLFSNLFSLVLLTT